MGLEAGTFISDLNVDWPLSTDKRRQGDDHFRLVKRTIKNSFPNITAAMTKTAAQLNAIPDLIEEIIPLLILHSLPAGSIMQWDLANKPSLPEGWVECNGQTVDDYGVVPDMRDKFIIGRGPLHTHATTGGASSVSSSSDGGHTPTAQGTALTSGQIPAHDHRLYTWETGASSDANNFATVNAQGIAGNVGGTYAYRSQTVAGSKLVENAGSAAATHTHTMDAVAAHTHTVATVPPYYTSIFIVKVTEYEAP